MIPSASLASSRAPRLAASAWGAALAVLLGASGARAGEDEAAVTRRVAVAVENTLRERAPEVHRCFEQALADRLDIAGRLELEVELGKGGAVSKVRAGARAPQLTAGLVECVVAAARSWRLSDVEPGSTVVLPLTFAAEPAQFVVRAADVPERGPAARGKGPPPFSLRILADPVNVRARDLAATSWTIAPAQRVAMHRHPSSSKLVFVLRGRARLLGPEGFAAMSLAEGAAVFVPRGFPHVLENMGRQLPVELLQVYVPGGPERVYRDPEDVEGRAHFEVVREPRVALPEGPRPVLLSVGEAAPASGASDRARARSLVHPDGEGSMGFAATLVEIDPGGSLPPVPGPAEFRFVLQGEGTLLVGQEPHPLAPASAAYLPAGQARGVRGGTERLVFLSVQVPAASP